MLNMVLDMDIQELTKSLIKDGINLKPYSKTEIEKAIKYFNDLPEKLIEYYQLIGHIDLGEPRITIYSPDELIKNNKADDEFIDIAYDYSGMFGLAIKQTDLKNSNPIIYLTGEVAIMSLEDEDLEEKLENENLLFELTDDEGEFDEVYISCMTDDMTQNLLPELPDGINVLKDLVICLNFFIKYYAKIENYF